MPNREFYSRSNDILRKNNWQYETRRAKILRSFFFAFSLSLFSTFVSNFRIRMKQHPNPRHFDLQWKKKRGEAAVTAAAVCRNRVPNQFKQSFSGFFFLPWYDQISKRKSQLITSTDVKNYNISNTPRYLISSCMSCKSWWGKSIKWLKKIFHRNEKCAKSKLEKAGWVRGNMHVCI